MTNIQLLLEDYIAHLRVGVLPTERNAPQRVRVNVSAELRAAPTRDDIAETYNYTQIIAAINSLGAAHVDLLETFAAQLAEKLLADAKIIHVEITLMKLDILDNGNIGVRYSQRN